MAADGPTWREIIVHWPIIQQDLHDMYGIDTDDQVLMRSRSWRWLQNRIAGLLNAPPVVTAAGTTVPATRLGWEFNPPETEKKPTE